LLEKLEKNVSSVIRSSDWEKFCFPPTMRSNFCDVFCANMWQDILWATPFAALLPSDPEFFSTKSVESSRPAGSVTGAYANGTIRAAVYK